jgi:hypothetical protein
MLSHSHKAGSHHGHSHGSHHGHKHTHTHSTHAAASPKAALSKGVYTKIFRWQKSNDAAHEPQTVEIVGSFTDWQRVPLTHDRAHKTWQLTQHNIASNKTHHYMLLVDGKPAQDKNCDGYAIPHGEQEKAYTLHTPRGERLFMLFAQTK